MSTLILRIIARSAFYLGLIVVPSALTLVSGKVPLWLNASGFVAIAVGTGVLFLNAKRASRFFTRDMVSAGQVHALSIQTIMLAVILAAISGIHWRTLGHTTSLIDNAATVFARNLYGVGTIGFFLTAGQLDDALSWGRISKVAIIITIIMAGVVGLLWSDQDSLLIHEPEIVIGPPRGVQP